MPEPLLEISGLTKAFHVTKSPSDTTRLRALDGISLTVRRGETLGSWASPAAASPPWRGPCELEAPDEGTGA